MFNCSDRRVWPETVYAGFQQDMSVGVSCTIVAINKTELYKYSMRRSDCLKQYGFVCRMNACLTGKFICSLP